MTKGTNANVQDNHLRAGGNLSKPSWEPVKAILHHRPAELWYPARASGYITYDIWSAGIQRYQPRDALLAQGSLTLLYSTRRKYCFTCLPISSCLQHDLFSSNYSHLLNLSSLTPTSLGRASCSCRTSLLSAGPLSIFLLMGRLDCCQTLLPSRLYLVFQLILQLQQPLKADRMNCLLPRL